MRTLDIVIPAGQMKNMITLKHVEKLIKVTYLASRMEI